jgi:hypothetical protein
MKRITICIDVEEEHMQIVEKQTDRMHTELEFMLTERGSNFNWDVCTDNVKDDEDVSQLERQAYGRAEGHMTPRPEDESQQALVEGHLEEKGLIELSPGEETSLDDLIAMIVDNHGCTEEVAFRTIKALLHGDETCDMTEIK